MFQIVKIVVLALSFLSVYCQDATQAAAEVAQTTTTQAAPATPAETANIATKFGSVDVSKYANFAIIFNFLCLR